MTCEKFNVFLEWHLINLILCTLLWFLKVSNMFTSSSRWLILFALRFMCLLVIFVKYLIIIVAIFPPSLTISFSSTSEMLVELKHVFEKNGRSSHGRCSFKKGALENFAKFTVIVFAKCTILDEACNFIKKRDSGTGGFLWILRKF